MNPNTPRSKEHHVDNGTHHSTSTPMQWPDHLDWAMITEGVFDEGHFPPAQVPHLERQQSSSSSRSSSKRKVSDATIYGPRFCSIFTMFEAHLRKPIDTRRHLMSLCVEYLVDFACWARESDAQVKWMSELLLENEYLRPEVRNGIIMVLVYTFSSIKASAVKGTDMFCTLQDKDTGMGIANRFSLKIYNDPFNFLSFLKTSLSALIDAGAIPENERMNQPKKSRALFQNKDEYTAFTQLKLTLISFLDSGDNIAAQNYVTHITSFWHLRGKYVRNKRFSSALASVAQIPLSTFSIPDPNPKAPGLANAVLLQALPPELLPDTQRAISNMEGMMSATGRDAGQSSSDRSSDTDSNDEERSTDLARKRSHEDLLHPRPSSSDFNPPSSKRSYSPPSSPQNLGQYSCHSMGGSSGGHPISQMPLYALRFEKVSPTEWEIMETRWFDVQALLDVLTKPVNPFLSDSSRPVEVVLCFVDETALQEDLQAGKLAGRLIPSSRGSLTRELQQRKALITSWPEREMSQFARFVQTWQECCRQGEPLAGEKSTQLLSLHDIWWRLHPQGQSSGGSRSSPHPPPTSSSAAPAAAPAPVIQPSKCMGYIAYEVVYLTGVILRANHRLNLDEDIWCMVYPSEWTSPDSEQSMAAFLAGFFPQLHGVSRENRPERISIKYYAHEGQALPQETDGKTVESDARRERRQRVDGMVALPAAPAPAMYQTIGTLSTPTARAFSRLFGSPYFHDIVLEVLE